jgi:N-acetyl-alpha-D-glucosaminyl L-malate synthase BshA
MPIRLSSPHERIHFHEVEVTSYPLFDHPPYTLALATKMLEVAEQAQLDLLHVHYAIPHSVSALLARMMAMPKKLPFITTLHGTDITIVGMDRSYFPITKFSIEQSDGITSVSQDVRRQTYEVFGVPNEIRVIYNFVNTEIYQPMENRPNGEKRLMHISNFRPVKRVTDCVRVLAEVVKQTPAHLYMVGDGPDRPEAHRLARELGIERQVTFLGKQDHVERLFPRMHVLLMPSEMESFGLGALEAMACGVPPVATRVGGLPELVTDGVDGFLEPVGDIAAQSRRVIELLTNEERHRTMAEAARRTAVERFASSTIIPQYEKYYEEVMANGAGK